MGNASAGPKRLQAALQRVATGERQHGVDAVGCEAARLIVDLDAFAIDHRMRPHLPHQVNPFLTRRSGKHPYAAPSCELHRERSHASGGSVNDDGLALLQTKGVVDALQRSQAGDRDRTGMPQVQTLGDRRGLVGGHPDIFCVKTALWILPVVAGRARQ